LEGVYFLLIIYFFEPISNGKEREVNQQKSLREKWKFLFVFEPFDSFLLLFVVPPPVFSILLETIFLLQDKKGGKESSKYPLPGRQKFLILYLIFLLIQ